MTSFEVDLHAGIDSPLHKLDPRAKIVALTAAVVAVSSTPATGLPAFPWYYSLIALLVGLSRIPPGWLLLRCLITSPFILMAAGLPAFSLWVEGSLAPAMALEVSTRAATIALKAYAAIILLALLVATTRFSHLLWSLRALRVPEILPVMAGLMQRYIWVLLDEWRRTTMARVSRAGASVRGRRRLEVFSHQLATIFLRGWDRATRIHWAMLSRGFTGSMPVLVRFRFGLTDAAFVAGTVVLFAAVRWKLV